MRFDVKEEGRSKGRWEYTVDFLDRSYSEAEFVKTLRTALTSCSAFEDFYITPVKPYELRSITSKGYALISLTKLAEPRKAIVCFKRVSLDKEVLEEILRTLMADKLNQRESQPCQNKQLDLFQTD